MPTHFIYLVSSRLGLSLSHMLSPPSPHAHVQSMPYPQLPHSGPLTSSTVPNLLPAPPPLPPPPLVLPVPVPVPGILPNPHLGPALVLLLLVPADVPRPGPRVLN